MLQHLEQLIALNAVMIKWCSKLPPNEQLQYLPKIRESIEYAFKCLKTAQEVFNG